MSTLPFLLYLIEECSKFFKLLEKGNIEKFVKNFNMQTDLSYSYQILPFLTLFISTLKFKMLKLGRIWLSWLETRFFWQCLKCFKIYRISSSNIESKINFHLVIIFLECNAKSKIFENQQSKIFEILF